MRLLNSIVAFIVGLIVVLFAVSNRETVTLEIWPLPYQLLMGLYAVILLALAVSCLKILDTGPTIGPPFSPAARVVLLLIVNFYWPLLGIH